MTKTGPGRRLWRLTTKTVLEHGTPVLFLEGRLDHARAAELEKVAGQLLTGSTELVVDVSGVDYLSSAALKVFATLAGEQSQRGGRLTLRAPSIAARLALELSGLLALVDSARPEDVGAAQGPPQTGAPATRTLRGGVEPGVEPR